MKIGWGVIFLPCAEKNKLKIFLLAALTIIII